MEAKIRDLVRALREIAASDGNATMATREDCGRAADEIERLSKDTTHEGTLSMHLHAAPEFIELDRDTEPLDPVRRRAIRANAAWSWINHQDAVIETLRADTEAAEREADKLREALVHIEEYWNGSETEGAMSDALHEITATARAALRSESLLLRRQEVW